MIVGSGLKQVDGHGRNEQGNPDDWVSLYRWTMASRTYIIGPAKRRVSCATILSRTQLARVAAALILISAAGDNAKFDAVLQLPVIDSDANGL